MRVLAAMKSASRLAGSLGLTLLATLLQVLPIHAQTAARVDNSTLTGKLIMGYQGWFACPDPSAHCGWVHWKAGDALTDRTP